jgi:response regulator RpfG family c-di-GMP phosphodiesterase
MRTILVVDSDSGLASTLRQNGYHVISADRADEAIRLLKLFVVDAIVCNLRLSDMSCGEFRHRLLARPEWSRIRVIGVTTDPESEEERSMYPTILHAPIETRALLEAISPATPS